MKKTIAILVVTFLLASPVFAAPTLQVWEFTNETPVGAEIQPDVSNNAYGTAGLHVYGSDGYVPFQWTDTFNGRQGVWQGDPVWVEILIPNSPNTDGYKKYVTFSMEYTAIQIQEPVLTAYDAAFSPTPAVTQLDYNRGLPGDWSTMTAAWLIEPNSQFEHIILGLAGTGGFIDSITVKTMCIPVPAPGAVVLGGLGAGLVGWLRRRKTV